MSSPSERASPLAGIVLGALWVAVGVGVGWAVGDLADRLAIPGERSVVLVTLALCAVVLVGWAYGTWLLYLEVRAGVDEATTGAPSLRRRTWLAAYAAPIVGVWLALSVAPGHHRGGVPVPRHAISVPAPASVVSGERASEQAGVERSRRADASIEFEAVLAGLGIAVAAAFAGRQRRRRALQEIRAAAGEAAPPLAPVDARAEAELDRFDTVEHDRLLLAAGRLLFASLRDDPTMSPPVVAAVGVGDDGVVLYLTEAREDVPEGFLPESGGRRWRLDRGLSVHAIEQRVGPAAPSYLPVLLPIGDRDGGALLVACGPGEQLGIIADEEVVDRLLGALVVHLESGDETTCYRLGPARYPGAGRLRAVAPDELTGLADPALSGPLWREGPLERQPVVLAADERSAAVARSSGARVLAVVGTGRDADRLVVVEGDQARIEPLGLAVSFRAASLEELALAERLLAASIADARRRTRPASSVEIELPAPGEVEIRLLRAEPDLAGELEGGAVSAITTSLIAYLAVVGEASLDALRDALVGRRRAPGAAERLLARAVEEARAVFGTNLVPHGWAGETLRLPEGVTCDWSRFVEMAAIARACDLAALPERAAETRLAALELVGPGRPGAAVRHAFAWLEAEQVLSEIVAEVVEVAHALALACIADGSDDALERAAWSIERGRAVSPHHGALSEAAMFLADARGDHDAVRAEFDAAVAAVDALELGEDVAPRLERLYSALTRDGSGRTH